MAFLALIPGLFGSEEESVTTIKQTSNTINENIFKSISEAMQNSTLNCYTNQNISLDLQYDEIINCPIVVNQTASTNCEMTSIFNSESSQSFRDSINNAISNTASSSSESTQGFLSTPVPVENTNMDISQYVQNKVSRELTDEAIQTCIGDANLTQEGTFIFKGKKLTCTNGGGINLGQDAQAKMLTSCLSSKVSSILTDDSVINQVIADIKATSKKTSTGPLQEIATGINNALKTVFGSATMIIIAIVIALVVIGFFVYKFLLSPAGQDIAKQGSEYLSGGSNPTPLIQVPSKINIS